MSPQCLLWDGLVCDLWFFLYFPFFLWVWMWCQNRISEAFSTGDILHVSLIQNKVFYALIYLIFTTDLSLIWNEVFYALIYLFSQLGSLIFLLIHALAPPPFLSSFSWIFVPVLNFWRSVSSKNLTVFIFIFVLFSNFTSVHQQ